MSDQLAVGLIASLQDRHIYSHPVSHISLIETHISWVILTGYYAYKIKKPVNFGFLDFSTLKKRHFFCDEELRLNQRFSHWLYVDVVKITGSELAPQINGSGRVLDYAVRMNEFSQQCLLSYQLQHQSLTRTKCAEMATQVAIFHRDAQRSNCLKNSGSLYGSAEAVKAPVLENFEQILPLVKNTEDRDLVQKLQYWTLSVLSELATVIEQRRASGFVRECHGDLHLGNIALIDDKITLFDCIEFSEQLRWIDTMSELAFLLMDIESNQQPQLANHILNQYLEVSGDYTGLQLLRFYSVYRALVRAKVVILRMQQNGLSTKEMKQLGTDFRHYVHLANTFSLKPAAFLMIMHGVSGSGKSTVSAEVAAQFQAIRLRSDVERKRLYGLQAHERSDAELKVNIYSAAASAKTFTHLQALTEQLLDGSYPVIVDACFIAKHQRDDFRAVAVQRGIPFIIVDCQADVEQLQQRLIKRSELGDDASEADVEVMKAQQLSREELTSDERMFTVVINTTESINFKSLTEAIARQQVIKNCE